MRLLVLLVALVLVSGEEERPTIDAGSVRPLKRVEVPLGNGAFSPQYFPEDTAQEEMEAIINATRRQTRIVGGEPVFLLDIPCIAYLKLDQYRCAGMVIDDNTIITAAHCTEGVRVNRIEVIFEKEAPNGFVDEERFWNICDGSMQQNTASCNEVINHPQYDGAMLRNDIALLKFPGRPFQQTRKYPIFRDTPLGTLYNVSGWGTTAYQGSPSCDLLSAQVSRTDCQSRGPGGLGNYVAYYAPGMMCARTPNVDACQGDSGGPLTDAVSRQLVGLVSWGIRCAYSTYPGVYTELGFYKEWILDNLDGDFPEFPQGPPPSKDDPDHPDHPDHPHDGPQDGPPDDK